MTFTSIEYFNDRGLAEFVVARLINSISRSTTIGPRIISLGFEKLKDDQESSELIKKILQSSSSPEVSQIYSSELNVIKACANSHFYLDFII